MKKKILIATLVLAMLITSVVALVACEKESLDGKYVEMGQENWYLLIEGDTIKYIKENIDKTEEIKASGTFTVQGDQLIVNGFESTGMTEFYFDNEKQHIFVKYKGDSKDTFTKEKTN